MTSIDDTNLFSVIGTDISSLESAWSAVIPSYADGVVEKDAPRAFKECTQRFIYYRKLLTPLPGAEKGITNPLIDLWIETSDSGEALNDNQLIEHAGAIEYESEQEQSILAAFCNDIRSDFHGRYVSWLQFQFTSAVTDGYVSRLSGTSGGAIDAILSAHEIVRSVANINTMLPAIEAFNQIRLPAWHDNNCRTKPFDSSVSIYALSYAYSLLRRGRQYGISLRGKSYTPHWSRIPVQWLAGIDDARTGNHEFLYRADWGDIIYTLVQKEFIPRDNNSIIDTLRSVRASVQSGKYDLCKDATLDQVKILEQARTYAKFAYPPFYAKAPDALQDLLKAIGRKKIASILGIITLLGNSRWVEKVDARATRIAMWDAYQRAFYIPKVVGNEPSVKV